MGGTGRRYTADGIEIRTIQPRLEAGAMKPDPTKPPPFAKLKPKPAGQLIDTSVSRKSSGGKLVVQSSSKR